MGGRNIKGRRREPGGENRGTEAKMSRGEKGGGAQAAESNPEGRLCPTIMTIMMA